MPQHELDVLLKVTELFNLDKENSTGLYTPATTPSIIKPTSRLSQTSVLDLFAILCSLCSKSEATAVTFQPSGEDVTLLVATMSPLDDDQRRRVENMIFSFKDFAPHPFTSEVDVERRRNFLI